MYLYLTLFLTWHNSKTLSPPNIQHAAKTLTSQSVRWLGTSLTRSCFPRACQRWRGRALLPDAGVPRAGGRRSGGQQGPPLLRLARRHLLAARHVAGDLWCQSNPPPRREGQWPSGRAKAASTGASAALSLFPAVIKPTLCRRFESTALVLIHGGTFFILMLFFSIQMTIANVTLTTSVIIQRDVTLGV